MEVRCGKCNKLFRVSDDKITGRGVKFSCTRCGESVKITREEFETYSLAQTAVSALDLFQPAPKPTAGSVPEPEATTAPDTSAFPPFGEETAPEGAAGGEPKTEAPAPQDVPDFLQEREEQPSPVANPFEESSSMTEQAPLEDAAVPSEPVKEPEAPIEPEKHEPQHEPIPAAEPEQKPEPAPVEPKPGPAPEPGPDAVTKPATAPVQAPESKPAPIIETPVVPRVEPRPAVTAKPAAPVSPAARVSAPEQKAAPRREPVHTAAAVAQKTARETAPAEPARSGRLTMIILAAVLIVGVAGLGAYLYLQPGPQAVNESAPAMVTMEGLQIVNATGSLDASGDLLISGSLENLTDKQRTNWYIVVDVFDAQGKTLNTIRMLNGKQIYTRRDYGLLTTRGANVQDLKEKALQPGGVALPPKGKASFEIRYLQPPDGIASFNAALQPYDPARLRREIEAETK